MTAASPRARVPFSFRAIQAWAKVAVSVVFRKVHVTAMSRLPDDRPVILAANHSSALSDVAIMIKEIREYPHFLAAASWWKTAPARMLFDAGGVVPIHRRLQRQACDRPRDFPTQAQVQAVAGGADASHFGLQGPQRKARH